MYRLSLILFFLCSLSAEVYILEKDDIENDKNIAKHYELISYINNNTALIQSETTPDKAIKSICIDQKWNYDKNYFLLLKRGGKHNAKLIQNYGTILHDAQSYTIFKSSQQVLNNLPGFATYQIVGLEPDVIAPPQYTQDNRVTVDDTLSPLIDSFVQEIKVDSILNMVGTLQDLERYTYASGVNTSVSFLEEYLGKLSFDTLINDNYLGNGAPNIIVEKKGMTSPDEIIVICSHYDVAKNGYPGADDNGSGSAGNLEIARIISDLSFHRTIRLVWFSGEEIGLLGSKDYAKKVYNAGDNIVALFNLDMIGYLKGGDRLQLDVAYDAQSTTLFNRYVTLAGLYTPDSPICDSKNSQWKNSSDHKSFWDKGYPALYFGDDLDPNGPEHPNYHQLSDTLGTGVNSKPYLEGVTKSVAAAVMTIAEIWQDTEIIKPAQLNANYFTVIQNSKRLVINEHISFSEKSTLKLVTPMGRIIKETQFSKKADLNLSNISAGRYLLIIENGSKRVEKQLTL